MNDISLLRNPKIIFSLASLTILLGLGAIVGFVLLSDDESSSDSEELSAIDDVGGNVSSAEKTTEDGLGTSATILEASDSPNPDISVKDQTPLAKSEPVVLVEATSVRKVSSFDQYENEHYITLIDPEVHPDGSLSLHAEANQCIKSYIGEAYTRLADQTYGGFHHQTHEEVKKDVDPDLGCVKAIEVKFESKVNYLKGGDNFFDVRVYGHYSDSSGKDRYGTHSASFSPNDPTTPDDIDKPFRLSRFSAKEYLTSTYTKPANTDFLLRLKSKVIGANSIQLEVDTTECSEIKVFTVSLGDGKDINQLDYKMDCKNPIEAIAIRDLSTAQSYYIYVEATSKSGSTEMVSFPLDLETFTDSAIKRDPNDPTKAIFTYEIGLECTRVNIKQFWLGNDHIGTIESEVNIDCEPGKSKYEVTFDAPVDRSYNFNATAFAGEESLGSASSEYLGYVRD